MAFIFSCFLVMIKHFQVRHFFQSSPFGGSLVLQNPIFSTNTYLLSKSESIPKNSAKHPKAEEIKKSSIDIFNNKWIISTVILNDWILKWWQLTITENNQVTKSYIHAVKDFIVHCTLFGSVRSSRSFEGSTLHFTYF